MNDLSDLLEVAKLGRTVGLKGALKLHNLSDFEGQFKKGAKFATKTGTMLEIKSYEKAQKLVIFEGFESVEKAGELVNTLLLRSIKDTRKYCKLNSGEYFYFDIIGCEIYENSMLLGQISDIMENGAGFLLCVQTDTKLVKAALPKEFFVPYNDHFVLEVDIKAKRILAKNSFAILENS